MYFIKLKKFGDIPNVLDFHVHLFKKFIDISCFCENCNWHFIEWSHNLVLDFFY